MTLTISAITEWLVLNGWHKIDKDDRCSPEDGGAILTPSRVKHWACYIHESGQSISVTPEHETLTEFPDCSYNDCSITFRFDSVGDLEDITFAESHSGIAFAYADAVAGFTPADLPALVRGLRSAYNEAIRCLDQELAFDQERLESALQFELNLFALFDVPEREEAN